jgi:hypothetical protein
MNSYNKLKAVLRFELRMPESKSGVLTATLHSRINGGKIFPLVSPPCENDGIFIALSVPIFKGKSCHADEYESQD